jgi:7,8-dihydro-6-hydroxymethylpterin-pyrophosphokinase
MAEPVALALGSNKGKRELNIKSAVKSIEKKFNTKVKNFWKK